MRRVVLGSLIGLVLTLSQVASAQDDLARELPLIKPLEPAAALKSFRIHPGFHLEPVAVEPLVADPVSVCYDADGRLYVVEMRGYPYPEKTPTGHVARLEDRDGDGRFDSRTVFVDGLSWPTGIVPFDEGVFIAVAPDILDAHGRSQLGRQGCSPPDRDPGREERFLRHQIGSGLARRAGLADRGRARSRPASAADRAVRRVSPGS